MQAFDMPGVHVFDVNKMEKDRSRWGTFGGECGETMPKQRKPKWLSWQFRHGSFLSLNYHIDFCLTQNLETKRGFRLQTDRLALVLS